MVSRPSKEIQIRERPLLDVLLDVMTLLVRQNSAYLTILNSAGANKADKTSEKYEADIALLVNNLRPIFEELEELLDKFRKE